MTTIRRSWRAWIFVALVSVQFVSDSAGAQNPERLAGLRPRVLQQHWCGTRLPDAANKAVHSLNLWPDGQVFYDFDASVTPENQQAMIEAMAEISAVSDVEFFERTIEP
ncbi:MAG: hypothetical protein PVI86_17165, partial [Phycisphaerae bacterium]